MKKLILLIIYMMAALSMSIHAQISSELSVIPTLDEGESLCKEVMEYSNTITKFETDLVFEDLHKQSVIALYGGFNYTIVLYGESNRIREIGLKIYGPDNNLIKSVINNSKRIIQINFKPDKSAFYKFEIIVEKFTPNYDGGRYGLIIAN